MSDNSNNTLGVLLAFIVGGVIGAGLALLYAPSSGEDTRKRLRKEMDKGVDKLREGYGSTVDTVEEGVGKVKEIIEERKGEFAAAYQAGKDAYHKERAKHTKETA